MIMYHCGKQGCPGHIHRNVRCKSFNVRKELNLYFCDRLGCPGHQRLNEECIEVIIPPPPISLQFFCEKLGCPGHRLPGERCARFR